MSRCPSVRRPVLAGLALTLAGALAMTQPPSPQSAALARSGDPAAGPAHAAERSGWTRTSTCAEVQAFLEGLSDMPAGGRIALHTFGASEEGRPLHCAAVGEGLPEDLAALRADDRRLRVLVNANIHAGEVEGKEAVQLLLRELAGGAHAELLEDLVLLFVPVYNADGNERIDRRHRVDQNGPEDGVGTRENAADLDLNRDFVKVESAECRALMGLFRRADPHVFMDLHATDGSWHGYHLTYSPSLSTNVDPAIDRLARETLLPAIRGAMQERHGWRVFDYGNFSRGEPRAWATYDHRPRFGTNYYGLRNRFCILSEAYSHLDFETRVRVTRDFVLESLRAVAAHADAIRAACAAGDGAARDGSARFGVETRLAEGRPGPVLVGDCEEVELEGGLGKRVVATPGYEEQTMLVRDRFVSERWLELPAAWLVPDPRPAELDALRVHGVRAATLDAEATRTVRAFRPRAAARSRRPFQGHHELTLEGEWVELERALPAGTLVVPGRQRLARVAAQLLEPASEDSLSTWNAFEDRTRAAGEGLDGSYPVLRLERELDLPTTPVPALDAR